MKDLVAEGDVDALVSLCFDDKKTLRLMQRLLYTPQEDERWYIAWMIGRVTQKVARREPGQVSEFCIVYSKRVRILLPHRGEWWRPLATSLQRGRIFLVRSHRHLLGYMADSSMQEQVIWSMAEIAAKTTRLDTGYTIL